MNTYRILYTVTEYRAATITAESESAARQAFIDNDLGDDIERLEDIDESFNLVTVDDRGPAPEEWVDRDADHNRYVRAGDAPLQQASGPWS